MCGAQFAENGKLKMHIRTHTGGKHYTCDTCGAQFAHSGALKKLIRTHTGETAYKCMCFAQFALSAWWPEYTYSHSRR